MEPLELHVWGPGFGLPSIDAECLAAIAYLHTALPSSEWRLVSTNDPAAVDSSSRLPALRANGACVTGYASIVSHLRSLSPHSPSWDLDLDSRLTPSERADALALGAYVESHVGPLLDAYLYADFDNWSGLTRPALSRILGFPLSWTVPVRLRKQAVARSAHLGFGALGNRGHDDDDDEDEDDGTVAATRPSNPGTMDRAMKHLAASGKKSVMAEMRARSARGIRIHATAVDALAPLEQQRARGEGEEEEERKEGHKLRSFGGGDVPTSLDCLVLGHLALVRAAEAPQNWLQAILSHNFPRLAEMVDDLREACLTGPGPLPWAPAPPSSSPLRTAARFLDDVVQATPTLGSAYLSGWRRRAEKEKEKKKQKARGVADARTLALAGGVLAAGTAIAYGAWWYRGLGPWGARTQTWAAERRGLGRFGALGAMLDFSFGLAEEAAPPPPPPRASPAAGGQSELSVD